MFSQAEVTEVERTGDEDLLVPGPAYIMIPKNTCVICIRKSYDWVGMIYEC